MDTLQITLTSGMLALVPIVAAIIQILKRIEAVQKVKEWMPFFSIAISYGLCAVTKIPEPILASVIIGLVACGGYDLLKQPTKTLTSGKGK